MANLLDLDKKSITEMSKEELQNLLLDIRKGRRTPTKKVKKVAKKKELKIDVNNMSKEEAEILLKRLEETNES